MSSCARIDLNQELVKIAKPSASNILTIDLQGINNNNVCLTMIEHQVLNNPLPSNEELSIMNNSMDETYGFQYSQLDTSPLAPELANTNLIKKIIDSRKSSTVVIKVPPGEFEEFVKAALNSLDYLYNNKSVQQKIQHINNYNLNPGNLAMNRKQIVLDKILLDYYKAYFKNNFVMRNGVKLTGPNVSFDFVNGQFTASVNNDTITGVITVLLEGIYECIFPTPVIGKIDGITHYSPVYRLIPSFTITNTTINDLVNAKVPKHVVDKLTVILDKEFSEEEHFTNTLIHLIGTKDTKKYGSSIINYSKSVTDFYEEVFEKLTQTNYFTETNYMPTAQLYFNLEQIVDDGSKPGISEKELNCMNFISNMAGEKSEIISGLIIKALGGFDLGLLIEGNFSIGDNDSLAKVVETVVEVSTRRAVEYGLYEFFNDYSSRIIQTDINELLNNCGM